MITTHAWKAKMAAINRIVNAAMTAIHNEYVQSVGRDSSSDDDDFLDRRRTVNMLAISQ